MSLPIESRLDAVIDGALAARRIVGAVVLVAQHGEPAYRRAAGLADREAGLAMREETIFRLASITKPIVTAAAMRLVERGLIALDEPVTCHLPAFRPTLPDGTQPELTLARLMTHTSGLGYRFCEPPESAYHRLNVSDSLDQPGLSLAENLGRLAQAPLLFAPGSAWRYSLGIDVLGGVMEAVTKKSLPDIVRDEVMAPLGLADTDFSVVDRARLAAAYADGPEAPVRMEGTTTLAMDEGVLRFTPDRIFDPASYPSGGGGMAGTAGDVLAFLEVIRKGGAPILKEETVAAMMRDQVGTQAETQGPGWGFGYGWAVLDDPAPTATPQSKGTLQWGGAYGHTWFVDPARELSVVAFTNTAVEGVNGRFVTDIRDAVYG